MEKIKQNISFRARFHRRKIIVFPLPRRMRKGYLSCDMFGSRKKGHFIRPEKALFTSLLNKYFSDEPTSFEKLFF